MLEKILEIEKDHSKLDTIYHSVTDGVTIVFERTANGKTAMHNAKKWARENGYTHLKIKSGKANVSDQIKKL